MRVVFHLKYFQAGRIGGQEQVIRGLARALAANPLAAGQRLYALCPPAEQAAVAGMCAWAGVIPVEMDAAERAVGRALRRLEPDLYLCPMAIVEPADPPCPAVAVIPDLQHETYPELFSGAVLANRRRSYGHAVRRADLVLTLSDYARGTILDHYPGVPPARVLAVFPDVDPAFLAPATQARPPGDLEPGAYLLFPANFWPHKNHARLLEALAALRTSGLAPLLVLTGAPASGFERVEREVERLGLQQQVRFLGRVSTEEFVPLLRGARALVFPSLYEGFGLPILEAFHCDTPVLCSSVTSCPEVAGDAALFLDPRSAPSLEDGLRRIWTDADLRAELVEKGRRRRAELQATPALERIRPSLLALASQPRRRTGAVGRLLSALGVG